MLAKCTANLVAAQFSVSGAFLVAKIKYLTRSALREKVRFEIAVQTVPVLLDEAGLDSEVDSQGVFLVRKQKMDRKWGWL